MLDGDPIPLTEGRTWTNPIYQSDINAQATRLLEVASVPATIVNWAGDEYVAAEEYLEYMGGLVGVAPKFDYGRDGGGGSMSDQTKRQGLIGPCQTNWRDGMRMMIEGRYPERALTGS